MTTERDYESFLERLSAFQNTIAGRVGGDFVTRPEGSRALTGRLDALVEGFTNAAETAPAPPDRGLAQLVGIGPDAAPTFGDTRIPSAMRPYDETVTSERIVAVADLYYIYQHERIGVFRVVQKLQELFRAGTFRLSNGPGPRALPVRPARGPSLHASRPAGRLPPRARVRHVAGPDRRAPEHRFPPLFTHSSTRSRCSGGTSGSRTSSASGPTTQLRQHRHGPPGRPRPAEQPQVHVVRPPERSPRRGHAAPRRGLPDPEPDDIKRLFGADNAWDVVEEVLIRHFRERLVTSPRQRMAVAGREVLRLVSRPHILQTARAQFEALLLEIAEYAEEWLTSAESVGVARRST